MHAYKHNITNRRINRRKPTNTETLDEGIGRASLYAENGGDFLYLEGSIKIHPTDTIKEIQIEPLLDLIQK